MRRLYAMHTFNPLIAIEYREEETIGTKYSGHDMKKAKQVNTKDIWLPIIRIYTSYVLYFYAWTLKATLLLLMSNCLMRALDPR